MNEYYHIEGLQDVYLEDSWVRSIVYDGNAVIFQLDIVLLESHKNYSSPKPGEQYCYRSASLRFERATHVDWKQVYMKPSIDANKEVDFGNINSFQALQSTFLLSGDWGELELRCDELKLVVDVL